MLQFADSVQQRRVSARLKNKGAVVGSEFHPYKNEVVLEKRRQKKLKGSQLLPVRDIILDSSRSPSPESATSAESSSGSSSPTFSGAYNSDNSDNELDFSGIKFNPPSTPQTNLNSEVETQGVCNSGQMLRRTPQQGDSLAIGDSSLSQTPFGSPITLANRMDINVPTGEVTRAVRKKVGLASPIQPYFSGLSSFPIQEAVPAQQPTVIPHVRRSLNFDTVISENTASTTELASTALESGAVQSLPFTEPVLTQPAEVIAQKTVVMRPLFRIDQDNKVTYFDR